MSFTLGNVLLFFVEYEPADLGTPLVTILAHSTSPLDFARPPGQEKGKIGQKSGLRCGSWVKKGARKPMFNETNEDLH